MTTPINNNTLQRASAIVTQEEEDGELDLVSVTGEVDLQEIRVQADQIYQVYASRESIIGRVVTFISQLPLAKWYLQLPDQLPGEWSLVRTGRTFSENPEGRDVEVASTILKTLVDLERIIPTRNTIQGEVVDFQLTLRSNYLASLAVAKLVDFSQLELDHLRGNGLLDWDIERKRLLIKGLVEIEMTSFKAGHIIDELGRLKNFLKSNEGEKLSVCAIARIKALSEQLIVNYVFNLSLNHPQMVSVQTALFSLHESVYQALRQKFRTQKMDEFVRAFWERDAGKMDYFTQIGQLLQSLTSRSEGVFPTDFWENPRHVGHLKFHRKNLELYKQVMSNDLIEPGQDQNKLKVLEINNEAGLSLYLHTGDDNQQQLWLFVKDHDGWGNHLNPFAKRDGDITGHQPVMDLSKNAWNSYCQMLSGLKEDDLDLSSLPLVTIGYSFGGAVSQQIAWKAAKQNPNRKCYNFAFGVPDYIIADHGDPIRQTPNYYGLHLRKVDDQALAQSTPSQMLSNRLVNNGFFHYPLHDPVHLGGSENLARGHVKDSYLQQLKNALDIPIRLYTTLKELERFRDILLLARRDAKEGNPINLNSFCEVFGSEFPREREQIAIVPHVSPDTSGPSSCSVSRDSDSEDGE